MARSEPFNAGIQYEQARSNTASVKQATERATSGCSRNVKIVSVTPAVATATVTPTPRQYMTQVAASKGWNAQDWDKLIFKESTWNYQAINPSSGVCGLAPKSYLVARC